MTGAAGGPSNRSHPYVPGLYGIFPTADGWLAIVGVIGKARTRFFEVLGRAELAEQFPQPLYFGEEKAALFPLLDEAFRSRSTAEWCELLAAADLRFAPVRDHAEVVADPAVWDNGYLARVQGPEGEVDVVAAPVTLQRHPRRALPPRPPSSASTPRRSCSSWATTGTRSPRSPRSGPPDGVRSARQSTFVQTLFRCVNSSRDAAPSVRPWPDSLTPP